MPSTILSTLINRMNRYQSIATIEEQYKVRDLDDAIGTLRRSNRLPWHQKKTSLRVFADVLEYPTAEDHDYLIYVDKQKQNLPFGQHLRAVYTSLKDFYEDPTNRNDMAEIWQNGTLSLGIRIQNNFFQGLGSATLDTASSTDNHTTLGDASDLQVNYVNFKTGQSSLQFSVVNSTNVATVEDTFSSFTDSEYKRKYYFRWVFLDGLPSDIELKFGADDSNYLTATVTTQFSGTPLVANDWNFVAFDLSTATTVGTVDTNTVFAYESITLNDAPTGTYYIDDSYYKQWQNLDYWYYSKYSVATVSSSQANQEYFFATNQTYSTDSSLIGPSEWADVVMYDAMVNSLTDEENFAVREHIQSKRDKAWQDLESAWPDLKPQLITNTYRFQSDYMMPMNDGYGNFGR